MIADSNASMDRRSALVVGGSVAGSLLSATAGLLPRSAQAAEPARLGNDVVLSGVTIVDTHTGKLSPNMTIVVEKGKISKIVPAGTALAGTPATVIDAHGTFAVPGFNDYHAHALGSSDPQGSLTMLLAHGITGFREMGAWNTMLEDRRAGTLMPSTPAPELLELAGEVLNGMNAGTPDIAVAEIRKQLARGADFIKIIDYSPEIFYAIAAECKKQNVRFIGHLAPTVDVREAAKAGMKSMEHMGPRDSVLLGCSTNEAALRPAFVQAPPRPVTNAGPVPRDIISRSVANPTLSTSPAEIVRYQNVIDTFSDARAHDLAAHFVAAGTWHVPTLIRVRTMAVGDDQVYRDDPNLQYIPAQTKAMWEQISQKFAAKFTPEQRATLKALYQQSANLVKPFKAAGVQMMAGSDLGGGFVVPGVGLHREFDLLEQAGLSPLDVLQMTTLNGATFLGREATMGSIAVGKDANLVLLAANPIASVQNLHRISAVVRAGSYLSASALEGMKKATADRVAAGVAYVASTRPPCC